jgi:hypothetical protein
MSKRTVEVKTVVSTTGDTGWIECNGTMPRRVFRVQAETNKLHLNTSEIHLEWCDETTFHREGARARWYGLDPRALTLANLLIG